MKFLVIVWIIRKNEVKENGTSWRILTKSTAFYLIIIQ